MANIGNIFQNMNVTLESRGKFLNSIGGFENFQTFCTLKKILNVVERKSCVEYKDTIPFKNFATKLPAS